MKNRRERRAADSTLKRMAAGEHEYGDAPVERRYREQMVAIIKTLDEFVNGEAKGADRETGIVVLMFKFGDDPGHCNFMSNGVGRGDIVTLFKEMIARFQGQPEIEGRAWRRIRVRPLSVRCRSTSRSGTMPIPA